MEYKVLQNERLSSLRMEVNRHLDDGWLPVGGMNTYAKYADGSGHRFYQTLIRTEIDKRN